MNTQGQPWSAPHPSGLRVWLRREPQAAREARGLVDGLADRLPAPVVVDVRAVVSELIRDRVLHGTGDEIELAIDVRRDGSVRGTVTTDGEVPMSASASRVTARESLGFRIVDALTSRWGVDANSSGIWFELTPAF